CRNWFRRVAYSKAADVSWIEQGPTTTSKRGSSRRRMRVMTSRPATTVAFVESAMGAAALIAEGGRSRTVSLTRKLDVGITSERYAEFDFLKAQNATPRAVMGNARGGWLTARECHQAASPILCLAIGRDGARLAA